MEVTNKEPITQEEFKKQQAAKYAGNVPEEEKLLAAGKIDSLKQELLAEEAA
jgi:hypothetical protein